VRNRRGIKSTWQRRRTGQLREIATYRRMLNIDTGGRGDEIAPTQLSTLWRDRGWYWPGRLQVPPLRHGAVPATEMCVKPGCGAIKERTAIASPTGAERCSPTRRPAGLQSEPPAIYGFVDFEGGGRWLSI